MFGKVDMLKCIFKSNGVQVLMFGQCVSSESMSERRVDSKITQCKELIIQNMEQTVQPKMLYMFLKERKRESDVKQYNVNCKDGIIKLQFAQHEKALSFYHDYNFVEKILIRPFNIYFNIQLDDSEMKKYYLEGLTEENQKPLFDAAKKLGICKIYSSYGNGNRGKLRTNGLLSYFRKEPISQPEFQSLEDELQPLGIKISVYAHDKERKLSLNIINYVSNDLYQQPEEELKKLVQEKAQQIYQKYLPGIRYDNLTTVYKKREADSKHNKPRKLLTRAVIDFPNVQDAYNSYEKLRIGTLKDEDVQVKLYFHSLQTNCYSCLVTQGIVKKEGLTIKQFEDQLLSCFKQINENVIQVSVSQSKHRQLLFGKLYFRSEYEGKKFLVDYTKHRSLLHAYYPNQLAKFDISLDANTLKKIRLAIKHGQETTQKIKKQNEENRKAFHRPPNTYPIPAQPFLGGSSMNSPPGIPPGIPPMIPNHNIHPNMIHSKMQPQILPPNMNKGMIVPNAVMFPPLPGTNYLPSKSINQTGNPPNLQVRLQYLFRDKQRFLDMNPNEAKRALMDLLRHALDESGVANGQNPANILNPLVKEKSVEQLIGLLENLQKFKQVALSMLGRQ